MKPCDTNPLVLSIIHPLSDFCKKFSASNREKTAKSGYIIPMMKTNAAKKPLSPEKNRALLRLADEAARKVLSAGFGRKQPADRVLAGYLRENRRCGARDRAFISETVYALLRFWGFLRRFLPNDRREELEHGAIRLTATELSALLMAGAFINGDTETAEMIAATAELDRLPRSLRNPTARANQMAEYFGCSVKLSDGELLPDWVKEQLPEDLDTEKFLRLLTVRPPMWLRMQGGDLQTVAAEMSAHGETAFEPHPKLADAVSVRTKVNLFTLESYRNGKFEIQDLASQCVGHIADPRPGERWLDPCAGAGGKTLHLAQLMRRRGTVVASDVRTSKLEDLRRRARRAGFPNIVTRAEVRRDRTQFDGILIDAPCSCSGVWRRNPGAQWKLESEDIDELAAVQFGILERFAPALRQGGVLVYATCSLFDAENKSVVRKFLDAHPEFKLDPFPHPLTGAVMPGMVRIDSADGDCDALFVAKMRKVK